MSHAPGAGRYTRELVRALAPLVAERELSLYEVGRAPRLLPEHSLGPISALDRRRSQRPRRLSAWLPARWRYADLELGGVEIFHQTSPQHVPLARARASSALTDFPRPDAALEALRRMAAIFVFSTALQQAWQERLGAGTTRLLRVNVGCEHWARELPEPLPAAEPVQWAILGRPQPGEGRELLRELAPAEGAQLCEYLPGTSEALLPRAIAQASVVLHFLPQAGTPVTALEALALGVPVLTPVSEVFEEALGACYLPVRSLRREDLRQAIRAACRLRHDANWQRQARAQAARFTWAACAQAHLEAWRAL